MTAYPDAIHVVTSIEEEASGPSYSVVRLAQAQSEQGLFSGIYSLAASPTCETRQGVIHHSFASNLTGVPGLGRLGFEAAVARDYPIVFGTLFIFGLMGLVVGIISDLMYVLVDPRIDFERREG